MCLALLRDESVANRAGSFALAPDPELSQVHSREEYEEEYEATQ